MNFVHRIAQKREGHVYSPREIAEIIEQYTAGQIPDYQMSAWAMAVLLRGMTYAEIAALTEAMRNSGTTLAWEPGAKVVDKHSSGGVGDKTSLIIAPLLAAVGLRVPMLSGRGLGATGGTLDKLEAIPGYRTDLSIAEIQRQVSEVGCVITGTTRDIAPADRKLYALRDVTGTVPSIALITASIMSKKLSEGLHALVLDVKFGSGAFMKSLAGAQGLATSLVKTGRRMGVATTAILSDMNQPLGRMAGNLVEVLESIDVLQGKGPADVRELSLELSASAMVSCGWESIVAARRDLERVLAGGEAFERFERMVAAQGGRLRDLPSAAPEHDLISPSSGYVASIDTEQLGYGIIELGGGRKRLEDRLDFTTGFEILVRVGDQVERGQPLLRVFSNTADNSRAYELFTSAFQFSSEPVEPLPLVIEFDAREITE